MDATRTIEPLDDSMADGFWAENAEVWEELQAFLQAAAGWTLGFVETNFPADADLLVAAIEQLPGLQVVALRLADPELRYVRDRLVAALKPVALDPDRKLVVVLLGLEQSLGMTGNRQPMLQDLNLMRDAYVDTVPHPLLLVLPDYALTRLVKFAPDFWAWRSGVFRFATTEGRRQSARAQTLDSDRILGSLDRAERLERIDLLQRLLMDCCPSGPTAANQSRKTRLDILAELGNLFREMGDLTRARELLQEGLALAADGRYPNNQALLLYHLAWVEQIQGEWDQAIAHYQAAIEGYDSAQNQSGRASALYSLAMIYADRGELERAIDLHQQSLEIEEQIGNAQGKAAILTQLGNLYANRGELERAIDLYQQSLEIEEQIGNAQGKATTLHQLGILHANRGELERAIDLYQQSLVISEQIGNAQGKAATLHCLGILYTNRGEIERASDLYQQSLVISEQIGNAQGKAATLNQLGILYANRGELERAIDLFQQSLAITEQIGDAEGKAANLSWLGALRAKQGQVALGLANLQEAVEIYEVLKSPHAAGARRNWERLQQMQSPGE